jgi:hypothetical protein
VVRASLRNVDDGDIFERKVMDNLPLDTWVSAQGHVVLIGDGKSISYRSFFTVRSYRSFSPFISAVHSYCPWGDV